MNLEAWTVASELLILNKRNVLDESAVNTVKTIYEIGKEQYAKYYKDVVNNCTHSIQDAIKKNSLAETKAKHIENISMLKNDTSLSSHLYVAMQHRESDTSTFFVMKTTLSPFHYLVKSCD